jgi:hypothetical protein
METIVIRSKLSSYRGHRLAPILIAFSLSVAGCSDSTSPKSIPNVAGNYTISETIPAATCSPAQLPAGGDVILTAFTQSYRVRIEQSGATIRLVDVDFPDTPELGTIDSSGRITITSRLVFQETPREGNRVFFVDLTLTRDLVFDSSTRRLTGTGAATNIFREGSTTNPVYTTCSRHGITLVLTPV